MPNAQLYLHDRPADRDTLGRLPFAKSLALSLPLPKDSPGLVVGIEGSWGSGKSTLIHLINEELSLHAPGPAPVIVIFNPWMTSATGALVESLLTQIAIAIGADASAGEKAVKAGETLLAYIGIFNKLKYLKYFPGTAWVGNIAEATDALFDATKKVHEFGEQSLKDIKKLLPTLDLAKQKQAIASALKELDRPIVIIVDDIDRLLPAEIQAMMQAIKAVADFPRTTYLLAYDRAIVATALASSEAAGVAYLAKIVQLAYPIPPLFKRQRSVMLNQKIHAFLSSREIVLHPFEDALLDDAISALAQLLPQPRDIVRMINRLVLSVPATRGIVNTVDVIVFEALSLRYPALRDTIQQHSEDFVGRFRDDEQSHVEGVRFLPKKSPQEPGTGESTWRKHLPEGDDAIALVCEFLFSQKNVRSHEHIDHLRLVDPDRLARLLRMTSLEGVPEADEMHALLTHPAQLSAMLASCDVGDTLSLLPWLCSYARNCPGIDVAGSIDVLVEHARRLDLAGTLDTELTAQLSGAIELLMLIGCPGRDDILLALATGAPLDIAAKLVGGVVRARDDVRRPPRGAASISGGDSDAAIDAAIARTVTRLRAWIDEGAPGAGLRIHQLLDTLRRLTGSLSEAQRATVILAASDQSLLRFLAGFDDAATLTRSFDLIDDAETLARRIESSQHIVAEYGWLIEFLRSTENRERRKLMRALSPEYADPTHSAANGGAPPPQP